MLELEQLLDLFGQRQGDPLLSQGCLAGINPLQ